MNGGETFHHDRKHARCRGTGFLIEHVLRVTEEGERWLDQALDCSCRADISTRPNFDRDRPLHVGMTQDQLDEVADATGRQVEEQLKGVHWFRSTLKPDSPLRRSMESWIQRGCPGAPGLTEALAASPEQKKILVKTIPDAKVIE